MLKILLLLTLVPFTALAITDNKLPIIAVLAQEISSSSDFVINGNYTSFISATYVKFVESAGARAVPVWINQDKEYYKNIVEYTNGLLLPGGAADFRAKGGYYDAAKALYEAALQLNKNGEYYPIFGICLGFEFLAAVDAHNNIYPLSACSATDTAMPLSFTKDYISSRMFQSADRKITKSLRVQPVTYNNHIQCVTPKNYELSDLEKDWQVMSTNIDNNGTVFISSFEHKRYPFYGVQFHPERNVYDRRVKSSVPHSLDAIAVSQYFSTFFVFECRKNGHKYKSWEEEHKALIYNYNPVFVDHPDSLFEQVYLF